jgi:hypothetical protein
MLSAPAPPPAHSQSRIFQRTALVTCTFTTLVRTALRRSYCATTWTRSPPAPAQWILVPSRLFESGTELALCGAGTQCGGGRAGGQRIRRVSHQVVRQQVSRATADKSSDSSVLATAATTLATAGGYIFDSICVSDTSSAVQWDGCVTRYRVTGDTDPTYVYGIDDAQAYGHETACCYWNDLHKGGVKNNYDTSRVDITKAAPSSEITDVKSCYNQTFGLTVAGFGACSGGTVCPDRWDVTRPSVTSVPEYHKVEWQGQTNSDREANAMSGYRLVDGYTAHYSIGINWDVHWARRVAQPSDDDARSPRSTPSPHLGRSGRLCRRGSSCLAGRQHS